MSAPALTGGAGFHGKIPAHGDFVSRNLPRAVQDSWHGWLEAGIAGSQTELGEGWLDAFMTAPVWRFAMAAGLCGPAPVAGVMIPSVDKVGRYFPFAVLVPAIQPPTPPRTPLSLALGAVDWYDGAQALALSALDRASGVDRIEAGLAGLPALAEEARMPPVMLPEPDPLFGTPAGAVLLAGPPSGLGAACAAMVEERLRSVLGGYTLWWTDGSERIPPCVLTSAGLPRPGAFTALLDGDTARWDGSKGVMTGWNRDE